MKEFYFSLSIPAEEYLAYYEGVASDVITTNNEGKHIKFPAYVLRPYLTNQGIYGRFVLQCDEQNKFVSIKKVS